MTREEALKLWLPVVVMSVSDGRIPEVKEAVEMAVKALEKEPCEDCDAVSRQAVLVLAKEECDTAIIPYRKFVKDVNALQPVTPQLKMGKWLNDRCSECGKGIEDLIDSPEWYRNEEPNFCPFCGIKMEKAENDRK